MFQYIRFLYIQLHNSETYIRDMIEDYSTVTVFEYYVNFPPHFGFGSCSTLNRSSTDRFGIKYLEFQSGRGIKKISRFRVSLQVNRNCFGDFGSNIDLILSAIFG